MNPIEVKFLKQVRSLMSFVPGVKNQNILIACSGGVDSMVLLALSRKLKSNLIVCYIDHGQREDTIEDIKLIASYCAANKITFHSKKLKLKPNQSEQVLREHRYKALFKLSKKYNASLFVAHHALDQVETYLFRLLRGAHPSSIKAMSSVKFNTNENQYIFRPLLTFSKSEILDYAKRHHIPWREDSSNLSLRHARNQIRLKLLPLLEEIRPKSIEKLYFFFANLEEMQKNSSDFAKASIVKSIAKMTSQGSKKEIIQEVKLADLLDAKGIAVHQISFDELKKTIDSALGSFSHKTKKSHWDAVKEHINGVLRDDKKIKNSRKKYQFPGGYYLQINKGQLVLKRED